jgi:hypothetical protein
MYVTVIRSKLGSEKGGVTYITKRPLSMSVKCLCAIDDFLNSTVINESLACLNCILCRPENSGKLLDNVELGFENPEEKMELVTNVFDLVDQSDVIVNLLVKRALSFLYRISKFLEENGFLVGLTRVEGVLSAACSIDLLQCISNIPELLSRIRIYQECVFPAQRICILPRR